VAFGAVCTPAHSGGSRSLRRDARAATVRAGQICLSGHRIFKLGDIRLQSGELLPDALIVYTTLGSLNAGRDNAVVLPTYFTGQHWNYASMIGPGKALDPTRYYIVIPNMFGNGLSTSPSNFKVVDAASFPRVTLYDNVVQQARLVFQHLGVRELALVCGWSLGGMQAYQWATLFPQRVRRLLPYCASARTSNYNVVFLKGLKAVLHADANWRDERCTRPPERGLRAFGRVYAGWAYSEEFFRENLYRALGFPTIEALLESWESDHLRFDANDLMSMLDTWQVADVGANGEFHGNTELALTAIQARTLLLPCSTDRYFSALDNHREAQWIRDCEVRTLESPFGHCALSPGRVQRDMDFLNGCIESLLSR
jgi:homoserine O-acetyltransferase